MKKRLVWAILVCSGSLVACTDGISTSQHVADAVARKAIDPGSGTASVTVHGASYGSKGEEVYPSSCHELYTIQDVTVDVDPGPEEWKVREISVKKAGCAIQADSAGTNINGGQISSAIVYGGGVQSGSVIMANNIERSELSNIPADAQVELWAAPLSGYGFMYWTITRADGTSYRDTSPRLVRSASSDEVDYFAEFKAGYTGGGGSGGGDDPTDPCDDPTLPGCGGGN